MKFSAVLTSGVLLLMVCIKIRETAAALIKPECIIKSKLFGAKQDGDVEFSNETQLTSEIQNNMEFYAYRECNDAKGNMKAFTIILSDENQQNRIPFQQIGAEDQSDICEGYTFPSPFIFRAAIFTESGKEGKDGQQLGGRITGIRFQSVLGVTDLGGPPDI